MTFNNCFFNTFVKDYAIEIDNGRASWFNNYIVEINNCRFSSGNKSLEEVTDAQIYTRFRKESAKNGLKVRDCSYLFGFYVGNQYFEAQSIRCKCSDGYLDFNNEADIDYTDTLEILNTSIGVAKIGNLEKGNYTYEIFRGIKSSPEFYFGFKKECNLEITGTNNAVNIETTPLLGLQTVLIRRTNDDIRTCVLPDLLTGVIVDTGDYVNGYKWGGSNFEKKLLTCNRIKRSGDKYTIFVEEPESHMLKLIYDHFELISNDTRRKMVSSADGAKMIIWTPSTKICKYDIKKDTIYHLATIPDDNRWQSSTIQVLGFREQAMLSIYDSRVNYSFLGQDNIEFYIQDKKIFVRGHITNENGESIYVSFQDSRLWVQQNSVGQLNSVDINLDQLTKLTADNYKIPANPTTGDIRTRNSKLIFYSGEEWLNSSGEKENIAKSGPYSNRPTPKNIGFQYFNTDTHKMITWDGAKWWNPDGIEATS